jgi:hypothetical protein
MRSPKVPYRPNPTGLESVSFDVILTALAQAISSLSGMGMKKLAR